MIRKAKAVWRGTGRAGNGHLSTDSDVLADTPYSFRTRFENEKGTNPEELIIVMPGEEYVLAIEHKGANARRCPFRVDTVEKVAKEKL